MTQPLYIAFVWHMHQPYYRDPVSGTSSMPWVRLHAAKDYLDMVTRLEAFPTIHQTFNMVPSLLDQLEEYLPPANLSDVFLDLSRKSAADFSVQEQQFVLEWFFLANPERMIRPYPRYEDLFAKRGATIREEQWPEIRRRFKLQDYLDLQVWFNLAWIDPWLRRQDPHLAHLEQKGAGFTEEEKRYVLEQHLEFLARVIPTYRSAAARGHIELSCSPYYHPILPLLCDLRAAHVALPHLPLPEASFRHPDDARWQLQQGLARHAQAFGIPARGVWPSEGAVSEEVVRLAIDSGVQWIATDEEILWRTLRSSPTPAQRYRAHRLQRDGGQLFIIFRDRELSDLIGFTYSHWAPDRAAEDFLGRLGRIHQTLQAGPRPGLVSIILDGENAWESYANDGHDFFLAVYHALAADTRFRCVTVSEFLQQVPPTDDESLPPLFSGSWIDANFATWVGHPEKNTAWSHLARLRETLGQLNPDDPTSRPIWQSLAAAEGSDWMWWFGDTHYSAQAEEFDRLFRLHVSNTYRLAHHEPPKELSVPIRRPVAQPLYRPTGPIHPTIDGRETSYYEWLYAGRLELRTYAAIHRAMQGLETVAYGVDDTTLYLRIDVRLELLQALGSWRVELSLAAKTTVVIRPDSSASGARAELVLDGESPTSVPLACAFQRVLEVAIPLSAAGLTLEQPIPLILTLRQNGQDILERYPSQGMFELPTVVSDLESETWLV